MRIAETGPIAQPLAHPHAGLRVARAAEAQTATEERRTGVGRAWLNGREVGGSDSRFQHLMRSYD